MRPSAPLPLPTSTRGPQRGLVAGEVTRDPVAGAPRRGRVRRWSYAAAGDADTIVGAAVVDLGLVAVAFAFVGVDGRTATWETRRPLTRGARVGVVPAEGASTHTARASVEIGGDGSLRLDVPTDAGRLRAEVRARGQVTPAVLATRTPEGGWNLTRKAAGTPVAGEVRLGDRPAAAFGAVAGGWSDWTVGRQDRRTTWRWGAGAGVTADGRRVGVNVSTGMNGREAGEDVVWWDGVPHALPVSGLVPAAEASGPWRLTGPGCELDLRPVGVRSADERMGPVTSAYVQPFGRWTGSLTDPIGLEQPVTLAGVAEDHLAVW